MEKVYYNYFAKSLVTLPDDKIICLRCEGLGYHKRYDICEDSLDEDDINECYLCEGLGCIDWITRVIEADWKRVELAVMEAEWNGHMSLFNQKCPSFSEKFLN